MTNTHCGFVLRNHTFYRAEHTYVDGRCVRRVEWLGEEPDEDALTYMPNLDMWLYL